MIVAGLLLDTGVDTSIKNNDKYTAPHKASKKGHDLVVRLLLHWAVDADIDTRHSYVNGAFNLATEGGFEKVVELLLDARAGIES